MGTINVAASAGEVAAHFTLEANTISTVIFDVDLEVVEIISRDGAADIWYTLDGSTPVPEGPRTYILPAGAMGSDEREPYTSGPTTVKFLSPGRPRVSVQRVI